jgi:NADH-quinone oxidoreductase subunit F
VARRITSFFVHESCGGCTPCRAGGERLLQTLTKVASGNGKSEDLTKLEELTRGITGVTFCPMGTGMCEPVSSGLARFRGEFIARISDRVSAN